MKRHIYFIDLDTTFGGLSTKFWNKEECVKDRNIVRTDNNPESKEFRTPAGLKIIIWMNPFVVFS